MALPDLTGQNIQDTYQRVLQVGDGGLMYDGTGSLFIPLSASHEITTELSSSHAETADASLSLTGLSTTVTELNYLDGITSAQGAYVRSMNQSVASSANTVFRTLYLSNIGDDGAGTLGFHASANADSPHIQVRDDSGNSPSVYFGAEGGSVIYGVDQEGVDAWNIDQAGLFSGTAANASAVTNGVYLNNAQTITGVKTFGTNTKLQFRDSGIYLNSNTDGTLQIASDNKVNIFGNAVKVFAPITGSDISASGNITAGEISSSGKLYGTDIIGHKWKIDHTTDLVISSSGKQYIQGSQIELLSGAAVSANLSSFLNVAGDITTTSHITASGEISASSIRTQKMIGHSTLGLDITGHITASNEISASGTVFAFRYMQGDENIANLYSPVAGSGNIVTVGTVSSGNVTKILPVGSLSSSAQIASDISGSITGRDVLFGHVTASGNISASGNLISDQVYTNVIRRQDDSSTTTKIKLDDEQIKFFANSSTNQTLQIEDGSVEVIGHITASGNISASGNINAQEIRAKIPQILTANMGAANLSSAERYLPLAEGELEGTNVDHVRVNMVAPGSGSVKRITVRTNSAWGTNEEYTASLYTIADGANKDDMVTESRCYFNSGNPAQTSQTAITFDFANPDTGSSNIDYKDRVLIGFRGTRGSQNYYVSTVFEWDYTDL